MLCQILLLHILSLDKVSGSQLENISDEKEVGVIYSPYPYGPEGKTISSAVLSVDLNDLTNFSVCFAFMVDVATHQDTTTLWHMLGAFSIYVKFDSVLGVGDKSFFRYR